MSPSPDKFKADYLNQVERERKTDVELRQEVSEVTNIICQALVGLHNRMGEAHLSAPPNENIYLLFDGDTVHPAVTGMFLEEGWGILVLGGNNFEKVTRGTLDDTGRYSISWGDGGKLYEVFKGLCLTSRGNITLLSEEGYPRMPGIIELKHTKSEADIVEHGLEEDLYRSLWQTAYYGALREPAGMLQIMQKIHAGLKKAGGLEQK